MQDRRIDGRRRFWNPKRRAEFEDLVAKGATNAMACEALGCSQPTLYAEFNRDEAWRRRVDRIRSKTCCKIFESILEATDWKAKAWALSRLRPAEFSDAAVYRRIIADLGLAALPTTADIIEAEAEIVEE
jgi:hypothetical protein